MGKIDFFRECVISSVIILKTGKIFVKYRKNSFQWDKDMV